MNVNADSQLAGKRSGPLTAIGTINLLVGIGAIVAAILALCLMPGIERDLGVATNQLGATNDPQLTSTEGEIRGMMRVMGPLIRGFSVATLTFGCVLTVASAGLLRMRTWARSVSLALAWLMVAWAVVAYGYAMLTIPLPGPSPKAWSLPYDSAYWVIVVVVLMSRDVRERFAQAKPSPAPAVPLVPAASVSA